MIVNPMKTGRGLYVKPFARGRAVSMSRKIKMLPSYSSEPAQPAPAPVAVGTGSMSGVIKKLESLQVKSGVRRKNISFQL